MGVLSEIGNVIKSNIAINKIKTGMRGVVDRRIMAQDTGGIRSKLGYTGNYISGNIKNKAGKEIAISTGKGISNSDRIASIYMNKDGSFNKTMGAATIAGGYLGVSSAARIVSGSGLYRDSDGNTDIIGVPFI